MAQELLDGLETSSAASYASGYLAAATDKEIPLLRRPLKAVKRRRLTS